MGAGLIFRQSSKSQQGGIGKIEVLVSAGPGTRFLETLYLSHEYTHSQYWLKDYDLPNALEAASSETVCPMPGETKCLDPSKT